MASLKAVFRKFPEVAIDHYLLREIREDDAEDLFELYSDAETLQYEGMIPLQNLDEMKQLIADIQNGYEQHKTLRWIIEDQCSKKAIGSIAMYYIHPWQRTACMGYALNRSCWKQGIMHTCMKGLLQHLYYNYHLQHVLLTIWPGNLASMALAAKLGFLYQGMLPGSGYNAVTKTKVDMCAYCLALSYRIKRWEQE